MLSPFSTAIRVLPCGRCAGGVSVPPVRGGRVPCRTCGATLDAPPRPDIRVARAAVLSETDRIADLRGQRLRPLLRPAGLDGLLSADGAIADGRRDDVLAAWRKTRARAAAGETTGVEQLDFLTTVLANDALRRGDDLALRPLWEGAVEALGSSPPHRQVMLCSLARGAARTGDTDSGLRWLSLCDPASDDLEADGAYRIAHAYVSTALAKYTSVLTAIGDGVPLADVYSGLACVLRANALEQLGDVRSAIGVLSGGMLTLGGADGVAGVAAGLPAEWRVCAESLPRAREADRLRAEAQEVDVEVEVGSRRRRRFRS